MASIIIVGGGLSGLSAAHTVLERGGNVVIVEKNPFLGGNSTKATSGINGALTKTQVKLGIKDSKEQFYDDTAKSARDLLMPELVEVLTHRSASAVDWLQEKFNLDLSLVSRLGGHSQPRTHRGKEKFPGMTITYALMERLEDMAKSDPNRVRVVKKARVQKLIRDKDGTVTGVEYEKQGKTYHETGPVILATGGFAADFADNGLLKQYRPEYYDLPTTNGDWSTGDGIKMVRDIGGKNIMMEMVQVHPTGLVDPQEPDAKVKFLAAEALRGVGGLLLTNEGHRFADELGHRDYVTGQMWKAKKAPYRLVLNGKAGKEIEWHCKHYMGRGLMKHFASGKELAKEMGISVDVLNKTFEDYNSFAKNKNDPFGKKYFHNLPFHIDDEFWVSIVTPVLHYCMGGLEINKEGEVLSPQGVIKGLFASGEVVGGVHGANRLGGSSLLGCVVFGRLAGDTASNYIQSQPASAIAPGMPQINLSNDPFRIGAVISHQGLQTTVSMEPNARRMNLEVVWTDANGHQVALTQGNASAPGGSADTPLAMTAGSPAESPEEKVPPPSHTREISLEEVAKHNKEDDCWVVVNGLVLDVTKFLADHPGGKKAILIYAGKDATDEFNMLHKPDVVDKYAPETVIGKLKGGTSTEASTHAPTPLEQTQSKASPPAKPAVDNRLKTTPSNKASLTSGGTADILPMERKKATFEVEKMTNVLDGGPDKTKRRRFILSPNKGVDMTDKYAWDAAESLKQHMKHFIGVHEAWWDTIIPTREEAAWMSEYSIFSGSLMNHYGLFLPTIEVHSSEEQRAWWSDRARRMQIIGCYAQTELGHGSNVRGLQTTATYDKKTQQFVLHTPTLSAMKWWPGTLGKVATHALVYAQLIIDGQEYGVHSFMVQIRDDNHMPLPGIELGDLGPKLGDHANDTGYMIMNNIRIPRQFMLARYQSVSEDGVYAKTEMKKQNSKLHYSTMIFTRGSMVRSAGGFLAKAATIATRYSCVRKQGFVDRKAASHKAEERQIIDYQMQRYRVFKQVALAYAVKFTGSWMLAKFSNMETKDHKMTNLDSLPEIAATSGALKSLVTFQSWSGIEDLRKCCGGNGYLMSAGVAPLAANYVWQSTAEGDWILLMLHTAQFLLKALQGAVAGNPLTDIMSYLKPMQDSSFDLPSFKLPAAKAVEDLFNLDYLLDLFKACALIQVASVGEKFSQRAGELGGKFEEAFNDISIELVTAVRAHCVTLLVSNFINTVRETQDQACRTALTNLCALYCCSNILDEPQWTGVIDADMVKLVKSAVPEIMQRIRPDAVALVDAFDIPDNVLCSNIGKFDGNVYEALYESAKKAPLNEREVFLGYEYLQPHLDKEFLKTKNALPAASLSSKAKTGKL